MTYPEPPPQPYQPFAVPSPLRVLYQSLVNVLRVRMRVVNGTPSLAWSPLPAVIDPFVAMPGQMMCRIDLQFVKRTDPPMPVVAGRAPDRTGTAFFDAALDPDTGAPFVLAGDRLQCVAGPVTGTFELRTIPTAALGFAGPHHIECQVFEVAQSVAKGSQTPFPAGEGPDT